MLSIAGLGMGEPNLSRLDLDLDEFDTVVVDKSVELEYQGILKLGYKDAKEYILANHDKEDILYLVSGSPLFFSAGVILAKALPRSQVKIIPNSSSKDYLLQKLFISEADVSVVSLHGRSHLDKEEFFRKRYTFLLCDKDSLKRLQSYLKWLNHDDYEVTIGYKLGFEDEVIKTISLETDEFDLSKPYVLLIERKFDTKLYHDDRDFETQRGMITKKLKRNITLSSLELKPNEILWDVGSGSGSCAIEAYTRYKVKTYLFEKQPQRVEFIKQNLKSHKVVDATLLEGEAQELFETIEENPNKIFLGGGGSEVIKKLPYLYDRLSDGGIIIAHAITLKNLTQMLTVLNEAKLEYEVSSFSETTFKGKLDMVEPSRQLFVIKIKK